MDFVNQECDFDQYFCYTFLKSESPSACIEQGSCPQHDSSPLLECHLHKSNGGNHTQYGHQEPQATHQSIHQFHPSSSLLQQIPSVLPSSPSSSDQMLPFTSKFSYTLVAQTLPAVKLTEEPVTCLNQGQSYDIKLKKHADVNSAKFYKSNIRLMFHHRRLQHSEQEQFQSWLTSRPDQRLLDLDLPLAYNVLSAKEDPRTPNMTTITWAGQTEASVSVKINCISTEFTAKKHGGEKGVPFRLQVDTYAVLGEEEHSVQLLHRAYCLVKVFKPNGADRKNKNDALKLAKIPLAERDLYHPMYDVTVFSEGHLPQVQQHQSNSFSPIEWLADEGPLKSEIKKQSNHPSRPNSTFPVTQCPSSKQSGSPAGCFSPEHNVFQDAERTWNECKNESRQSIPQPILTRSSSSLFTDSSPSPPSMRTSMSHDTNPFASLNNPLSCSDKVPPSHLTSESTSNDLKSWLRLNNFEKWTSAFEHYSGAEIFMLSKEDFMKICGVAEGIRMFYKIYSGLGPSTKKSIYVSYMSGVKKRLYMRKNFSSDSLESPSSVSSTVTTGSCSNLLANNISDMSLDHQHQVRSNQGHMNSVNHIDSNPGNAANCLYRKGSKRSRDGGDTPPRYEDDNNNNLDIPHCKKNKFSDDRDVELPVYSAVHLKWLTYAHLAEKLSETFDLSNQAVAQIYLVDRDGTDIAVNDEIVERLRDHSIFTMDLVTDGISRKKYILLIPLSQKDY